MDLFQIQLDSPNGVFYSGEQISGNVHLHLRKPVKARGILIEIQGKACTSWTVTESRDRYIGDNRSGTRVNRNDGNTSQQERVSVPYKAEVTYINAKVTLWQPIGKDQQKIPYGLHTFPFTFILPVNCPPTFESKIGFIRYFCKARIDRPWKIDDETKTVFTVMPKIDLNTIQYAAQPIVNDISKNVGVLCFKHGRINARIFLPKCGYVPGEKVQMRLEISNGSSKNVIKVKYNLLEIVQYTANRVGHQHQFASANVLKRDESRIILKLEDNFCVIANSNGEWLGEFQLPPVPIIVTSFNGCPIIQITYQLQLKLVTNGTFGNELEGDVPLIIGTIPIQQNQDPAQFGTQNQQYLASPQPTAPNLDYTYGYHPT